MKRLIINADDFGMTQGVTTGIIHAHLHGIVTSTCLMTNMPSRFLAARLSQDQSELGVGIHLNMTCFRPLLPAESLPSLVTENGWFHFSVARASERANLAELELEWRAQIEEGIRLISRPSHLDLHMGTTRLDVLQLIMKLAKEYGLPTRRPPQGYVPGLDQWIAKQEVVMPDHTEYFEHAQITTKLLIPFLRNLPEGVTEVMCHPGYISPEHEYIDDSLQKRLPELHALCNQQVRETIEAEGIELVNFHRLQSSS